MGALLWVQVPPQIDHSERSEVQLHEGDRVWGGSADRSCEPMDKNRIKGAAKEERKAEREGVSENRLMSKAMRQKFVQAMRISVSSSEAAGS